MRKLLITIHLWLGLVLGGFWALQGTTGAILVFHREIERMSIPAVAIGPIASLDRIAALGGPDIDRVGIIDGRGDLFHVDRGPRRLFVDPVAVRVLDEKALNARTPLNGNAIRWVYRVHDQLLGGHVGEIIIGISGLVLMTTTLMGLWIAWPRRRQWRAAFDFKRWRSGLQRLYGWHRATGLAVGVAFVAITLSGTWMVFEQDVRPPLVHAGVIAPSFAATPGPVPNSIIGPQAALVIAQRRFPEARFVRISMPSEKSPVYSVRFRQPGESRAWLGTTSVALDPSGGRVLASYDAVNAPLGNWIADAAMALHNGELAGLFGRLAVILAGLALPTLYVTGILRWWRRRTPSINQR